MENTRILVENVQKNELTLSTQCEEVTALTLYERCICILCISEISTEVSMLTSFYKVQ